MRVKIMRVIVILTFSVLTGVSAAQSAAHSSTAALEVTFAFTRQNGHSNQFALWIEDTEGKYLKTLYITRWTANGGYRRTSSIPEWVKKSEPSKMIKSQIDAISGATPKTGKLTFTWDRTDDSGATLPAGDYVLVIEGTLRLKNQVYCKVPVTVGKGATTPKVNVEYVGNETAERSMIKDVKVIAL